MGLGPRRPGPPGPLGGLRPAPEAEVEGGGAEGQGGEGRDGGNREGDAAGGMTECRG